MAKKPEDKAREDIDRMLEKAGWDVQDIDHTDIYSRQGVAIRDFLLRPGHGFADQAGHQPRYPSILFYG